MEKNAKAQNTEEQVPPLKVKKSRIGSDERKGFLANSPLRFVYIPLLIVVFVILFFTFYNRFLVDNYMNNLYTSLDNVKAADAASASILLDVSMQEEVSKMNMDSEGLASTEFSKRMLESEGDEGSGGVESMLSDKIQKHEQNRGPVLVAIDKAMASLSKVFSGGLRIPFLTPEIGTDDSKIIRIPLEAQLALQSAKSADENRNFEKAIEGFAKYLSEMEEHRRYKSVKWLEIKLKLAYAYYKNGSYQLAKDEFSEIVSLSPDSSAADTSRVMLENVEKSIEMRKKIFVLKQQAPKVPGGKLRQKLYFKMGQLLVQNMRYKSAAKVFELSAREYLGTDVSDEAYFKMGWCLKNAGEYEAARDAFNRIRIRNSSIAYQVADTYQKEGLHDEALRAFDQASKLAATEKNGNEIKSMSMFQSGYTYLHEYNDPTKAAKYFKEAKEFSSDELNKMIETKIKQQIKEATIELYGQESKAEFLRQLDEYLADNGAAGLAD